jgi:hypothetical protein
MDTDRPKKLGGRVMGAVGGVEMKYKRTKQRPCSVINCPHCNGRIEFYYYSGMGGLAPHFYCDSCSNILFRDEDRKKLYGNKPSKELLEEITKDLPNCICGGRFKAGANPKCHHCKKEIKHKSNPVQRLNDPYVIQNKGAYLLEPETIEGCATIRGYIQKLFRGMILIIFDWFILLCDSVKNLGHEALGWAHRLPIKKRIDAESYPPFNPRVNGAPDSLREALMFCQKWDDLRGWQQGVLGLLIVVASFFVFVALAGVVLKFFF